jgi:AraC family transcriptional regulator, regulatory protein of adaptative response / methylated-DNA-[protein]-cysteine methyltransferase
MLDTLCDDYQRMEAALQHLHRHWREQPDLASLAASLGLSEFQTQRLFTRWAGVSPKRFLQFLGKQAAHRLLLERQPVLEVAGELGLSGGGRLHDLTVNTLGATPGEISSRGAGLDIRYGIAPSPFGNCLIGVTPRGICHLAFIDGDGGAAALAELRALWPRAQLQQADAECRQLAERIFFPLQQPRKPLSLLLRGTNFQISVWQALLRVPPGSITSYGDLARSIEKPGAARAVGQAVGRNAIAYLIPCHRVLREMGELGGYRWGGARKIAMLGRDQAS